MSVQPLHNEKELIVAIARGDAAAFGKLYEHYRRKVYFIATQLLQSDNETEDVQQEIFTKLWFHREKLPGIDNFNSYLNTLIRNHIFNALRKKAVETKYLRETLSSQGAAPEDVFIQADLNEMQSLLRQAVQHLPGQQRKAFELVKMEGRSHVEAGAMMGISHETIKKHVMEAQKNIFSFFKNSGKAGLMVLVLLIGY